MIYHYLSLCAGLFIFAGEATGAAVTSSGKFSKELQDEFIRQHNTYRSTKLPFQAADMMQLVWSDKYATLAQELAVKNQCELRHDTDGYGQNLYWDSGFTDGISTDFVSNAMQGWGDDELKKDIQQISTPQVGSKPGVGIYDHYSQIVWAKTQEVGCGYAVCGKDRLLVCNYYPPGNYVGEGWFEHGPSCSKCPSGTKCVNGMCSAAVPASSSSGYTSAPAPQTPKPTAPQTPKPTAPQTPKPTSYTLAPETPQPNDYTQPPATKKPCLKRTRRHRRHRQHRHNYAHAYSS